ncbi:MAG TPA: acetyl-CoA carboxylase biotin carboxylase subunit [Chloroflexota bacterium]|nr:acetyl-CoA carboxylase biotin carboxylase subunit [Chloroflexota bacterium]
MFSKVLIANRGEIAVRLIQACAELGIITVAVYSDADARARHVRLADESYRLGPGPATASYLDVAKIVAVARSSGAEAIHPGYGFLAEQPALAEACQAAGLCAVGPPPQAMRLLGNKREARLLAQRVGVPVVPGYDGDVQDEATLVEAARRLGFPVLIKAVAGGGGRGMRLVESAAAFPEALQSARREARSAFDDDGVLLERVVPASRHVELQILGDAHGQVVHLGERECSVQRRRQKVIEESPSPALSPERRATMGEAAVRLARAAGYVNAGTVEFLLGADGEFYFLEVNTRLQVEHPVTELVTGIDLVHQQLRLAAGEPLAIRQEDVRPRGHAIECRIYAEDPSRGFRPATGRLLHLELPSGPGVRNDSGVEAGDEVSHYYDPLLAKLIVTAPDRPTCIARALSALRSYVVLGLTTNLPLLRAVLESEAFRSGDLSTDFLEQHLEGLLATADATVPEPVLLGAAGWQLTAGTSRSPWQGGPWQIGGEGLTLGYGHGEHELSVVASRRTGDEWTVRLPGGERSVRFERGGSHTMLVREGPRVWRLAVAETDQAIHLNLAGTTFVLQKAAGLRIDDLLPASPGAAGRPDHPPGGVGGVGNSRATPQPLQAPFPGVVVKLQVELGDTVDAGQPLLILEAMKSELAVTAPYRGTVRRLPYAPGDVVQAGAVLVELDAGPGTEARRP